MVGVLIVVGILGYAVVYSGISELPNSSIPPTGVLTALWPNGPMGKATARDFPSGNRSNTVTTKTTPGGR